MDCGHGSQEEGERAMLMKIDMSTVWFNFPSQKAQHRERWVSERERGRMWYLKMGKEDRNFNTAEHQFGKWKCSFWEGRRAWCNKTLWFIQGLFLSLFSTKVTMMLDRCDVLLTHESPRQRPHPATSERNEIIWVQTTARDTDRQQHDEKAKPRVRDARWNGKYLTFNINRNEIITAMMMMIFRILFFYLILPMTNFSNATNTIITMMCHGNDKRESRELVICGLFLFFLSNSSRRHGP